MNTTGIYRQEKLSLSSSRSDMWQIWGLQAVSLSSKVFKFVQSPICDLFFPIAIITPNLALAPQMRWCKNIASNPLSRKSFLLWKHKWIGNYTVAGEIGKLVSTSRRVYQNVWYESWYVQVGGCGDLKNGDKIWNFESLRISRWITKGKKISQHSTIAVIDFPASVQVLNVSRYQMAIT